MLKHNHFLPVALVFITFGACATHKKAHEKALEYEAAGFYERAAAEDLKALKKKSDFIEAQAHLRQIAPLAYREMLDQAESLEAANRWIEAVETWQSLDRLLAQFHTHSITIESVDLRQHIAAGRERGAHYYYILADSAFEAENYEFAIDYFQNTRTLAGDYRDSQSKIGKSWLALGDQRMGKNDYQQAIRKYEQAGKAGMDGSLIDRRRAEAFYQWGDFLFAQADYRNALEKYERCESILPEYKDVADKADNAYENALQIVVILPADHAPHRRPRAISWSESLASTLRRLCSASDLKFTEFLDREETERFVREYRLQSYGRIDEHRAVEAARKDGMHFIIIGAIDEEKIVSEQATFVEKTLEREVTKRDSSGKMITVKEPAFYRLYSAKHTLQIAAHYQIIEIERGRHLDHESFRDILPAQTIWISYQGSIYDLPEDERHLLDASQEPHFTGEDYRTLIRNIAEDMKQRIVQRLRD